MAENDNNSDRRPWWKSIAPDLLGIAGAASMSYGAWLIWPPVGFIVGGILLLSVATLIARAS